MWPAGAGALVAEQVRLAVRAAVVEQAEETWTPSADWPQLLVGGCWVSFPRGLTGRGDAGDPAWAAAVVQRGGSVVAQHEIVGEAGGPYEPGLLALRLGPLLSAVVEGLDPRPEVLLLDASGHDHPRRAGLAVHLGAVLDLPTVGVTHRPLLAEGPWPADERGATSALRIDEEVVASWVRTRAGTRPLVVHPGWRVGLDVAVDLVLAATSAGRRTPEPLRAARQLARMARLDG